MCGPQEDNLLPWQQLMRKLRKHIQILPMRASRAVGPSRDESLKNMRLLWISLVISDALRMTKNTFKPLQGKPIRFSCRAAYRKMVIMDIMGGDEGIV